MLFSAAFLFDFLVAGLTGIVLSVSPFDWQLGNSYFVVAHFHFVLVGAILTMVFAAFYYWFPKMSGRMLSERLGRWHFWLFLFGFHLTFDLMHLPGLMGMPRRIYTYEADRGWAVLNLLISLGVLFQIAGTAIFLWNPGVFAAPRERGRARSVGRMDAGVGHRIAAAGVQLLRRARRAQPPAAMGSEASRRSGYRL